MTKSRIELTDTLGTAVIKLSDGNPGAIRVCFEMCKESPTVDPDGMLGGIGPLLSLDTHRIYGSRIWMLYSDACGQDIAKALACLRAVQLGLMSETALDRAIDNRGEGLDAENIVATVQARLPRFGKAKEADAA